MRTIWRLNICVANIQLLIASGGGLEGIIALAWYFITGPAKVWRGEENLTSNLVIQSAGYWELE